VSALRAGNIGDSQAVGEGVSESRIDFGPGYRIYFGVDGDKIILLCGGIKDTQDDDIEYIESGLRFWSDYKKRTRLQGA